jgi:hypothetical protein
MSKAPWSITCGPPPPEAMPAPGGAAASLVDGGTLAPPLASRGESANGDKELDVAARFNDGGATGAELRGVPGGIGTGAPTTGLVASAIVAQAQSKSAPRRASEPLLKAALKANPCAPLSRYDANYRHFGYNWSGQQRFPTGRKHFRAGPCD